MNSERLLSSHIMNLFNQDKKYFTLLSKKSEGKSSWRCLIDPPAGVLVAFEIAVGAFDVHSWPVALELAPRQIKINLNFTIYECSCLYYNNSKEKYQL